MSELADLEARVAAASARLEGIPATGPGVYGAPDPETGERWNAGNVLGHLAELVEFWPVQARALLAGGSEAGRGQDGYARRKQGIESGTAMSEAELRRRIGAGCAELVTLLRSMQEADLRRPLTYHARTGDRQVTLGIFIEELLVGHLEGHADQLERLSLKPG